MKFFFIFFFIVIFFVGCSSETKRKIDQKKTNDIQVLLQRLIEKEKEINELNKKIEFYEKNQTIE